MHLALLKLTNLTPKNIKIQQIHWDQDLTDKLVQKEVRFLVDKNKELLLQEL